MEALRRLYEALNLVKVKTYVQSGNVVFDSEKHAASILTERIEAQIEQSFGYSVPVFIRSINDFHRIITNNPFLKQRNYDPAKLHVTFLYTSPSEMNISSMKEPIKENDEFSLENKEIFLYCPSGYGRTRVNNNYFERKLNMPATTRNWKTVKALYKIAKNK